MARFSTECWATLLRIEQKRPVNSYFFQWLRAKSTEEEILHNLEALEKGDVKLTQLNIKGKVSSKCFGR